MALHHSGRWFTCGAIIQAMTVSKNSVSRASRGRFFRLVAYSPHMYHLAHQRQCLQAVFAVRFAAGGCDFLNPGRRSPYCRPCLSAISTQAHRRDRACFQRRTGAPGRTPQPPGVGQIQPQLETLYLLGVAADQFIGLGGFFQTTSFSGSPRRYGRMPSNSPVLWRCTVALYRRRAARPAAKGGGCSSGAGYTSTWRLGATRSRPESAQRKARFGGQCGHAVQPALWGLKGHLHPALPCGGNISPAPVLTAQHGQADAITRAAPLAQRLTPIVTLPPQNEAPVLLYS
jgi:hypothetical protein